MTEIRFYHLKSTPLEKALPRLLEKVYALGIRSLILAESEEQVETLATQLWTYNPGSFLPHGTAKDGHAQKQPIYLSAGEENPNNARLLVVVDGRVPDFVDTFDQVLDIFDEADEARLLAARTRWSQYKARGFALTYWRQRDDGGWEKQA